VTKFFGKNEIFRSSELENVLKILEVHKLGNYFGDKKHHKLQECSTGLNQSINSSQEVRAVWR
jgi:hypothetical protein